MVVHADGHIRCYLFKGLGNGVQTGDPVVVILDRGEAQLRRKVGVRGVDAAELVDGHLPILELSALRVVGKLAQHQFATGLLLVGEPCGINGRQAHHVVLFALQPDVFRLDGIVVDAVVVALVAQPGGKLRGVLQRRLPVLLKEIVESLAVGLDGSRLRR